MKCEVAHKRGILVGGNMRVTVSLKFTSEDTLVCGRGVT